MVPSLPFVLINGKTDLPRKGHENITGELIKKKMWENISVHGCKQRIFQMQNLGLLTRCFPKPATLNTWTHTHKNMC